MIDLHEGVAELFEEAGTRFDFDDELHFDNYTAAELRYEATWIIEAQMAPVVRRWRCAKCGEEIVLKPGASLAVHLGSQAGISETGCRRMVKP